MPEAHSMQELNDMLSHEVAFAMLEVKSEVLKDMHEKTTDFYNGTEPEQYVRTYTLRDTPRTVWGTEPNGWYVRAYLDINYIYKQAYTKSGWLSGDANATMYNVLNLANYHKPWITNSQRPANLTIGKTGFWERSLVSMRDIFYDTLRKHGFRG